MFASVVRSLPCPIIVLETCPSADHYSLASRKLPAGAYHRAVSSLASDDPLEDTALTIARPLNLTSDIRGVPQQVRPQRYRYVASETGASVGTLFMSSLELLSNCIHMTQ
jgi:hypothetical protein